MPETLADEMALARQLKVHPDSPDRPSMTVFAPCCGRRVSADMVADLRGIPDTVARPAGRGAPQDLEFACDGCRWRVERSGDWTPSRLMRARGYPWATIKQQRAKELAHEEDRSSSGPFRMDLAVQRYMDELPDTDIPGTEPPTG